jgi:predicted negative regulator of RcsB-dependent stress response|tara:strand:+ start:3084 stop:3752 length:669 start_codon:yes stop_codon:yes gene_type:complete
VAINAAEEETIESLKKWWDENGKQLMLAIVVVVGGYGSWTLWQGSKTASSDAASDLYEEVLGLAINEQTSTINDEDAAQIIALAAELRQEHSSTIYARYSALFSAQQQVMAGDLDAAEETLLWITENPLTGLFVEQDEGLMLTANLRLGRVLLANGDNDGALAVVSSLAPKTFEAGYAELQGDVYVAMGRIVEARESYLAAQQAGSNSEGLRMKLDNLSEDS